MSPAPDELVELRARTAASYGWRRKSALVSDGARMAMTEKERDGLRWGADTDLIHQLAEAERRFTDTFTGMA